MGAGSRGTRYDFLLGYGGELCVSLLPGDLD